MAIKTASAKGKGRRHQQWVRDRLLDLFPDLEPDDIKSTSMGASGEDVQLSPAARKQIPISIECKAYKSFAVYKIMDQATENSKEGIEPVAIIKADRKSPLAVVDAVYFLKLLKQAGANP
jgi:hypothetical protein